MSATQALNNDTLHPLHLVIDEGRSNPSGSRSSRIPL